NAQQCFSHGLLAVNVSRRARYQASAVKGSARLVWESSRCPASRPASRAHIGGARCRQVLATGGVRTSWPHSRGDRRLVSRSIVCRQGFPTGGSFYRRRSQVHIRDTSGVASPGEMIIASSVQQHLEWGARQLSNRLPWMTRYTKDVRDSRWRGESL